MGMMEFHWLMQSDRRKTDANKNHYESLTPWWAFCNWQKIHKQSLNIFSECFLTEKPRKCDTITLRYKIVKLMFRTVALSHFQRRDFRFWRSCQCFSHFVYFLHLTLTSISKACFASQTKSLNIFRMRMCLALKHHIYSSMSNLSNL